MNFGMSSSCGTVVQSSIVARLVAGNALPITPIAHLRGLTEGFLDQCYFCRVATYLEMRMEEAERLLVSKVRI